MRRIFKMENEKKEFIKYSRPVAGFAGAVFGGVFFLIGIFMGGELTPFYHVLVILFGAAIAAGCIYSIIKYNNKIKQFESNGEMVTILSDFRNGTRAFDDKLIAGQVWLIGKKTGTIIKYSDITRMYQTVHKTNYVEDGRSVTAVTKDGKTHELCKLKLRGKSNDELNNFFAYINSRNPEIHFGYDGV